MLVEYLNGSSLSSYFHLTALTVRHYKQGYYKLLSALTKWNAIKSKFRKPSVIKESLDKTLAAAASTEAISDFKLYLFKDCLDMS